MPTIFAKEIIKTEKVRILEYKFLGQINNPADLKKLNNEEAELLCGEIREELIRTVSQNGGHLASNLGVVELTVALHRVFDAPTDPIVFDVGHQCYPHKLLTGRFDRFSTIRREGGISGFMRPDESEYDPFVTGHASNSLAAVYGIYKAKRNSGTDCSCVAVIGDGAMTGGLAFEALNNIGDTNDSVVVVLNDNKMSISGNVGSLSKYFSKIRTKKSYYIFKAFTKKVLGKIPLIGKYLYSFLAKLKAAFKNVIYRDSLFEGLGFKYLGPVDGHDLDELENILTIAKKVQKPCLVHIITTKGKGYEKAESNPSDYHGVSSFNVRDGVTAAKTDYSHICGKKLLELAEEDRDICTVTAAMCMGTGLEAFAEKYPDRFFDVGIAEEYAVTFAAGLAAGGAKPYFAVYSTFLQRAYDEIIHDTAIAGLPVRLLIDRAGIVGEDGETHQGVFDVAFLTTVHNMTVYSPASYNELCGVLEATREEAGPVAIRYPRGKEDIKFDYYKNDFTVYGNDGDRAIVTYGRISSNALKAQAKLQEKGIRVDFIKLNKIYPLSNELIRSLDLYEKVYIFEEVIRSGGIGEHLAGRVKTECEVIGIENGFIPAMSVDSALRKFGLDTEAMVRIIESES